MATKDTDTRKVEFEKKRALAKKSVGHRRSLDDTNQGINNVLHSSVEVIDVDKEKRDENQPPDGHGRKRDVSGHLSLLNDSKETIRVSIRDTVRSTVVIPKHDTRSADLHARGAKFSAERRISRRSGSMEEPTKGKALQGSNDFTKLAKDKNRQQQNWFRTDRSRKETIGSDVKSTKITSSSNDEASRKPMSTDQERERVSHQTSNRLNISRTQPDLSNAGRGREQEQSRHFSGKGGQNASDKSSGSRPQQRDSRSSSIVRVHRSKDRSASNDRSLERCSLDSDQRLGNDVSAVGHRRSLLHQKPAKKNYQDTQPVIVRRKYKKADIPTSIPTETLPHEQSVRENDNSELISRGSTIRAKHIIQENRPRRKSKRSAHARDSPTEPASFPNQDDNALMDELSDDKYTIPLNLPALESWEQCSDKEEENSSTRVNDVDIEEESQEEFRSPPRIQKETNSSDSEKVADSPISCQRGSPEEDNDKLNSTRGEDSLSLDYDHASNEANANEGDADNNIKVNEDTDEETGKKNDNGSADSTISTDSSSDDSSDDSSSDSDDSDTDSDDDISTDSSDDSSDSSDSDSDSDDTEIAAVQREVALTSNKKELNKDTHSHPQMVDPIEYSGSERSPFSNANVDLSDQESLADSNMDDIKTSQELSDIPFEDGFDSEDYDDDLDGDLQTSSKKVSLSSLRRAKAVCRDMDKSSLPISSIDDRILSKISHVDKINKRTNIINRGGLPERSAGLQKSVLVQKSPKISESQVQLAKRLPKRSIEAKDGFAPKTTIKAKEISNYELSSKSDRSSGRSKHQERMAYHSNENNDSIMIDTAHEVKESRSKRKAQKGPAKSEREFSEIDQINDFSKNRSRSTSLAEEKLKLLAKERIKMLENYEMDQDSDSNVLSTSTVGSKHIGSSKLNLQKEESPHDHERDKIKEELKKIDLILEIHKSQQNSASVNPNDSTLTTDNLPKKLKVSKLDKGTSNVKNIREEKSHSSPLLGDVGKNILLAQEKKRKKGKEKKSKKRKHKHKKMIDIVEQEVQPVTRSHKKKKKKAKRNLDEPIDSGLKENAPIIHYPVAKGMLDGPKSPVRNSDFSDTETYDTRKNEVKIKKMKKKKKKKDRPKKDNLGSDQSSNEEHQVDNVLERDDMENFNKESLGQSPKAKLEKDETITKKAEGLKGSQGSSTLEVNPDLHKDFENAVSAAALPVTPLMDPEAYNAWVEEEKRRLREELIRELQNELVLPPDSVKIGSSKNSRTSASPNESPDASPDYSALDVNASPEHEIDPKSEKPLPDPLMTEKVEIIEDVTVDKSKAEIEEEILALLKSDDESDFKSGDEDWKRQEKPSPTNKEESKKQFSKSVNDQSERAKHKDNRSNRTEGLVKAIDQSREKDLRQRLEDRIAHGTGRERFKDQDNRLRMKETHRADPSQTPVTKSDDIEKRIKGSLSEKMKLKSEEKDTRAQEYAKKDIYIEDVPEEKDDYMEQPKNQETLPVEKTSGSTDDSASKKVRNDAVDAILDEELMKLDVQTSKKDTNSRKRSHSRDKKKSPEAPSSKVERRSDKVNDSSTNRNNRGDVTGKHRSDLSKYDRDLGKGSRKEISNFEGSAKITSTGPSTGIRIAKEVRQDVVDKGTFWHTSDSRKLSTSSYDKKDYSSSKRDHLGSDITEERRSLGDVLNPADPLIGGQLDMMDMFARSMTSQAQPAALGLWKAPFCKSVSTVSSFHDSIVSNAVMSSMQVVSQGKTKVSSIVDEGKDRDDCSSKKVIDKRNTTTTMSDSHEVLPDLGVRLSDLPLTDDFDDNYDKRQSRSYEAHSNYKERSRSADERARYKERVGKGDEGYDHASYKKRNSAGAYDKRDSSTINDSKGSYGQHGAVYDKHGAFENRSSSGQQHTSRADHKYHDSHQGHARDIRGDAYQKAGFGNRYTADQRYDNTRKFDGTKQYDYGPKKGSYDSYNSSHAFDGRDKFINLRDRHNQQDGRTFNDRGHKSTTQRDHYPPSKGMPSGSSLSATRSRMAAMAGYELSSSNLVKHEPHHRGRSMNATRNMNDSSQYVSGARNDPSLYHFSERDSRAKHVEKRQLPRQSRDIDKKHSQGYRDRSNDSRHDRQYGEASQMDNRRLSTRESKISPRLHELSKQSKEAVLKEKTKNLDRTSSNRRDSREFFKQEKPSNSSWKPPTDEAIASSDDSSASEDENSAYSSDSEPSPNKKRVGVSTKSTADRSSRNYRSHKR